MRNGKRGPRRKIVGVVEVDYVGRWREREVLGCGHLHLVGSKEEYTRTGKRHCRDCLNERPPQWDLEEWEPIGDTT